MSNYTAYNRVRKVSRVGALGSSVVEAKQASINQPVKKMNIIKRLFIRAVAWAHDHRHFDREGKEPQAILDSASHTPDSHPLRLQIWYAQGGIAIETSMFDRQRDENHRQFYIIPEDRDLAKELDQILTITNLRR